MDLSPGTRTVPDSSPPDRRIRLVLSLLQSVKDEPRIILILWRKVRDACFISLLIVLCLLGRQVHSQTELDLVVY